MVDIEELKRLDKSYREYGILLEVEQKSLVKHLSAIIAELESLREQVRKPDARRLAEAVVDKSHIWIDLPPNGMKDAITSIIEKELQCPK